jgi:hypothetical protein
MPRGFAPMRLRSPGVSMSHAAEELEVAGMRMLAEL